MCLIYMRTNAKNTSTIGKSSARIRGKGKKKGRIGGESKKKGRIGGESRKGGRTGKESRKGGMIGGESRTGHIGSQAEFPYLFGQIFFKIF